jgi:prepilin-type N-terminal cleavage/methylation domain-containing protein
MGTMSRLRLNLIKENRGFTLVEMAVVLIIIGVIIGAIIKGKSLVRGAEQKKIYTKYVNEWRIGYLNFYDRTGKILGDTWDAVAAPEAEGQDGQADTAGGSAGAPTNDGRDDLFDGPAAGSAYMGMTSLGLEAPTTNTANSWKYKYVDSKGNAHFMDIAFVWDDTNNYNYMLIDNVPGELAIALDTMIDGSASGTGGDFLNDDGTGPAAWPTVAITDATARWKMQF